MDPNANLTGQLEMASRIVNGEYLEGDMNFLAEYVLALDEWITKGGFLPDRWEKTRTKR